MPSRLVQFSSRAFLLTEPLGNRRYFLSVCGWWGRRTESRGGRRRVRVGASQTHILFYFVLFFGMKRGLCCATRPPNLFHIAASCVFLSAADGTERHSGTSALHFLGKDKCGVVLQLRVLWQRREHPLEGRIQQFLALPLYNALLLAVSSKCIWSLASSRGFSD